MTKKKSHSVRARRAQHRARQQRQRRLYYGLAAAGALIIIGMGVSAYHYLLQLGVFGHSSGCTIGVPCNSRYVDYFGFVTIPFMALTAFILITIIMVSMERYKAEYT